MKSSINRDPSREELVAMLDKALAMNIGLMVKVSQPEQLKAMLDGARLPRHSGLEISVPAMVEHLAILKKGADVQITPNKYQPL